VVGSRICVIDDSSVRATSKRRRDAGNITRAAGGTVAAALQPVQAYGRCRASAVGVRMRLFADSGVTDLRSR
jgi:hypothetical protein